MPDATRLKQWTVASVLLAGALLRLLALPLPGTIDVTSWKVWSFVASGDPAGLYGTGGNPPERRTLNWNAVATTTDYPPLSLYELGIVGRIYWRIDPLYRDTDALTVAVKMPGILAETAFVAVLLTWGRRRLGPGAVWAALMFWLNPAVLLNGSVLGYLDAQMAVPAVFSLLAATTGHFALAGMLAAAAVLTKLQAVFALPAVALAIWIASPPPRARGLAAALLSGITTGALIVMPVVLHGSWQNMLQAVGKLASQNMLSALNVNAWWIATWLARSIPARHEAGLWAAIARPVRILQISDWMRLYPNPRAIGAVLLVAAVAWGCWRIRRGPTLARASLLAAWCVYAYTMLAVNVHENHLYLAIPFAALAAGLEPKLRPLAWTISAIAAANLYVFYGLSDGYVPIVGRRATGIDLTIWLAFLNVAVFAWTASTVHRGAATVQHGATR
jgi:hypothetical protein